MAGNSYFQFKQFLVNQDQCGMKVTSDACLFGAITEVDQSKRILDIGAGTGLLSLMAAQRSSAEMDAVELDDYAAEQCRGNFMNSPWSERLKLHHCAIQDYSAELYDTIITNPPFFTKALKAPCKKRSMARHTDSLSLSELLASIYRLLSDSGCAWVLLPTDEAEDIQKEIKDQSRLFIHQKIAIRPSMHHKVNRIILVIGKEYKAILERSVMVYEEGTEYSKETRAILEPYYLKLNP